MPEIEYGSESSSGGSESSGGGKKSIEEVAKDVINGDYGNGAERKAALEAAGYDYAEVQAEVNRQLYGSGGNGAGERKRGYDNYDDGSPAGRALAE